MAYNSFINKQVGTQSPKFEFKKDRANAAIVSGDGLGEFNFLGFDGTAYLTTSRIISTSSGTIAANRIGSNLEFYTHPDSAVASTQRMVINSEGNVTINAPTSGAALTVTGVAGSVAADFIGTNAGGISVYQSNGGAGSYQAVQSSVDVQPVYFNAFKNRAGGIIVANDVIYQLNGFGFADTNRVAALQRIFSTNIGANYVSGGFDWWTTSTAGATNQRMILGAEGNVTINAPVSGIALNIVAGGETITAGNLTLSAGNVNIPTTTSSLLGNYQIAGNRVLHAYGANNIFVGGTAGNYTGTGIANTVLGDGAFTSWSTGSQNTCIGNASGQSITTGSYNVGLGYWAAINTGSGSSNICINNFGAVESNTLRIGAATGTGAQQLNRAFICGIDNVNVGSVAKVLTMASDQIGTATITAGAGISVTPGANTITIATTNGVAWTEVTGTSQAMAVDNGYIASNAGLVTLTLPATAVVGDRIRIAGKGAGGWRCGQNAGQTINFGNTATTAGVAGYIDSTNQYDALELLCITANTTWVALSSVGNLNVV